MNSIWNICIFNNKLEYVVFIEFLFALAHALSHYEFYQRRILLHRSEQEDFKSFYRASGISYLYLRYTII